jgi:hypothetical protein
VKSLPCFLGALCAFAAVSAAEAGSREDLQKIRLPDFELTNVTFSDAIKRWADLTKKNDPERREPSYELWQEVDGLVITPKFSLKISAGSAVRALEQICKAGNASLEWDAEIIGQPFAKMDVRIVEFKPEKRTIEAWTNTDGKTIQARFLGMRPSGALLQTEDGKTYVYPLEKLDPASRERAQKYSK